MLPDGPSNVAVAYPTSPLYPQRGEKEEIRAAVEKLGGGWNVQVLDQ